MPRQVLGVALLAYEDPYLVCDLDKKIPPVLSEMEVMAAYQLIRILLGTYSARKLEMMEMME